MRCSGNIIEANPQCLDLSGYATQELPGKTFSELGLWFPEEREKADENYTVGTAPGPS